VLGGAGLAEDLCAVCLGNAGVGGLIGNLSAGVGGLIGDLSAGVGGLGVAGLSAGAGGLGVAGLSAGAGGLGVAGLSAGAGGLRVAGLSEGVGGLGAGLSVGVLVPLTGFTIDCLELFVFGAGLVGLAIGCLLFGACLVPFTATGLMDCFFALGRPSSPALFRLWSFLRSSGSRVKFSLFLYFSISTSSLFPPLSNFIPSSSSSSSLDDA
jgi:hypothetical protein